MEPLEYPSIEIFADVHEYIDTLINEIEECIDNSIENIDRKPHNRNSSKPVGR